MAAARGCRQENSDPAGNGLAGVERGTNYASGAGRDSVEPSRAAGIRRDGTHDSGIKEDAPSVVDPGAGRGRDRLVDRGRRGRPGTDATGRAAPGPRGRPGTDAAGRAA